MLLFSLIFPLLFPLKPSTIVPGLQLQFLKENSAGEKAVLYSHDCLKVNDNWVLTGLVMATWSSMKKCILRHNQWEHRTSKFCIRVKDRYLEAIFLQHAWPDLDIDSASFLHRNICHYNTCHYIRQGMVSQFELWDLHNKLLTTKIYYFLEKYLLKSLCRKNVLQVFHLICTGKLLQKCLCRQVHTLTYMEEIFVILAPPPPSKST